MAHLGHSNSHCHSTFVVAPRRSRWSKLSAPRPFFGVHAHSAHQELRPFSEKVRDLPAGWLIPVAILVVISFPPLFGHEVIALLCGVVYGLWIGFAVVAAGTFLGESKATQPISKPQYTDEGDSRHLVCLQASVPPQSPQTRADEPKLWRYGAPHTRWRLLDRPHHPTFSDPCAFLNCCILNLRRQVLAFCCRYSPFAAKTDLPCVSWRSSRTRQ